MPLGTMLGNMFLLKVFLPLVLLFAVHAPGLPQGTDDLEACGDAFYSPVKV